MLAIRDESNQVSKRHCWKDKSKQRCTDKILVDRLTADCCTKLQKAPTIKCDFMKLARFWLRSSHGSAGLLLLSKIFPMASRPVQLTVLFANCTLARCIVACYQ